MTYEANEIAAMALRALAALLLLAAGAMLAIDGLYWLRSGLWVPERLGTLIDDPGPSWIGLRIISDQARRLPLHATMAVIGGISLLIANACDD